MRPSIRNEPFEPELSRHLGPVKAPDQLWERMNAAPSARASLRSNRTGWNPVWAWTGALALVALATGLTLWLNRDLSGEQLAVRALDRTPEQLQFRTDDPAELRAWVKTGTSLDVPLPVRTSSAVQIVGANVSRLGTPTAEISYLVGGVAATLVVSKIAMQGDGRHAFVKSGSYHGSTFQSWTMRGQMYTIASADAKVGCILCHSTGAPGTSLN
jgi:hypothetical protein